MKTRSGRVCHSGRGCPERGPDATGASTLRDNCNDASMEACQENRRVFIAAACMPLQIPPKRRTRTAPCAVRPSRWHAAATAVLVLASTTAHAQLPPTPQAHGRARAHADAIRKVDFRAYLLARGGLGSSSLKNSAKGIRSGTSRCSTRTCSGKTTSRPSWRPPPARWATAVRTSPRCSAGCRRRTGLVATGRHRIPG